MDTSPSSYIQAHPREGALGKNVKVSFLEFLEFLDLNKINYAKAERLKSEEDGRVLPVFQLEINEAEALLSQNLVCQVTGTVYDTRWRNFGHQFL